MGFRSVIIIILIFISGCAVQAQNHHYKFSHIEINKGLSDSRVKCFLKDKKGFIWIGTLFGLNRYDGYNLTVFKNNPRDTSSLIESDITNLFEDPFGKVWVTTLLSQNVYNPETETFQRDTHTACDELGIPHGLIRNIIKGSNTYYWVSHATAGLFRYKSDSREMVNVIHDDHDTTSISSNDISSMAEDGRGGLWLFNRNGILERLDVHTMKVTYRNAFLYKIYDKVPAEYNLIIDADGDIWVYLYNSNQGIFYFNLKSNTVQHIDKTSPGLQLDENIVRGLVQDDQGQIWVATDHGGINIIDKNKPRVQYIFHNDLDEKSIAQNSINVLYKDREGFIWAGTFKNGVSYFHKDLIRFDLYQHQPSDPNSLPFNDINAFAEDDKGNVWIGTNGDGLVYFNRKNQTFKKYKHNPGNVNTISSDVIVSLFFDSDQILWIGTYYGGLNSFDGKQFKRYKHAVDNTASLADDNIWDIYEDSQKRLWIGTIESGVDLYNPAKNTFIHYKYGEPHSLHSSYVATILEDKDGSVWFGTGYGIDVLPKHSADFIHYLNDVKNPKSLSNNGVLSLLEDSRGNMWVGTTEGLNLFDKKTQTFKIYTMEQGLPHNTILTMQEDNKGNLWLGTSNGLSNMILERGAGAQIDSYQFRNYSESDGLQGKQFNEGAVLKTRSGEMIFGGSNGFNLFDPNKIILNTATPQVSLSDFQILNKSVKVGEKIDGNVVLPKAIDLTREITLKHNNNIFSLEFAALSFFHPEKSHYKYILKGFSKDWLYTDASARRVTYTNLDPGEYTFIVKASNNDGVWSEEALQLKITILPPFWKTKTAFFFYLLLILGALLLSRQMILQRERMRYHLEKERREALQVHELDMMKIKFFTNVSHEFRTPLSLIITPLEKLLKQSDSAEQKVQFQMIYRNARRLLNMVNQLLDFRKMEVQEVKLNLAEGDIIYFIKETANSFSDLSEKKSIGFSVTSNVEHLETIFDKDKLEKILFNLLSNAFKFTPEHGKVGIAVNVITKFNSEEKWLEIKVSDTGIGIPAEKHDKIFERFFQHDLPTSMVNQGSGIGLSITKEFVKAHAGTITVESEPDKGSSFIVSMPIREISIVKGVQNEIEEDALIQDGTALILSDDNKDPKRQHHPVLLLVEDNEDFRFYLKDNLKAIYTIIEARDGKEGYLLATQHQPDLIVSDVMMPEMNGIELCKKLKADKTTSHIPVILLTARAAEEQRVEGFETGADDYITKPFSFEILQSRIKNLIHQRELFHQAFRKQIEVKPSDINITSMDEKLIQNAIKLVEDNISDADFSVENLSHELGMSRVHLYKKLLSLTGKAPLEFIRTIRIQRAAQLLEKSQLTVSEVAYKVGFNNPKYFTKYFKEEYNMLPSTYASSKRKNIV